MELSYRGSGEGNLETVAERGDTSKVHEQFHFSFSIFELNLRLRLRLLNLNFQPNLHLPVLRCFLWNLYHNLFIYQVQPSLYRMSIHKRPHEVAAKAS